MHWSPSVFGLHLFPPFQPFQPFWDHPFFLAPEPLCLSVRRPARTIYLDDVADQMANDSASSAIKTFSPILVAWWDRARSGGRTVMQSLAMDATHDRLFEGAKIVYAEYLKDGFEHLEKLPRSWDNIFPVVS